METINQHKIDDAALGDIRRNSVISFSYLQPGAHPDLPLPNRLTLEDGDPVKTNK